MAYRYGNSQWYNFPVGIYDTLEIAENEANLHRNFRGGKYDHKIYLIELNRSYDAEDMEMEFQLMADKIAELKEMLYELNDRLNQKAWSR
jgi:hypothetical protein